jgi:hypothetical protein
MHARLAARNIEEDLRELDETARSIERLGARVQAQERRIAALRRDGVETGSGPPFAQSPIAAGRKSTAPARRSVPLKR